MDSLNQVKLDTGIDMMSTERSYFLELHQLMNEVYHDLLKHKTSQDFEKEQMEWLQFFEEKSIKIWKPINESVEKNEWLGLDAQLIVYGQQADLVHERIIVLINQF
ncbi:hypothetical protein NMS_1288 [Nonlabens marinus S1-08]|uniref:Uncharacterized protein n=2 Tax=Nonlabens TaxID=363408 RepID=W8VX47_9FLAO|nr:hypothetical protein NMS_1288 [Nonlabens marinus S1-08]